MEQLTCNYNCWSSWGTVDYFAGFLRMEFWHKIQTWRGCKLCSIKYFFSGSGKRPRNPLWIVGFHEDDISKWYALMVIPEFPWEKMSWKNEQTNVRIFISWCFVSTNYYLSLQNRNFYCHTVKINVEIERVLENTDIPRGCSSTEVNSRW